MNPKNSIEPKKEISPNKNSPNQDFKGMTNTTKQISDISKIL